MNTISGKKITLYLAEGLPKGIRKVKIDQWSGLGVAIPRNRLNEIFKDKQHASINTAACVYFLIGEASEGGLLRLYVGEADGFEARIKDHDNKKDWWKDVIMFMSQDGSLNKTGIQYLESVCVERLKKAGKSILENNKNPNIPTISQEDVSGLEIFYENIALILPVLGVDIFVSKNIHTCDSKEMFYCTGKGVKARGILLNDGKIKVLKDSEAVFKNVSSFNSHFYNSLKKQLLKIERIKKKGSKLIFVDDYVFDSPSAAAAIILARSASGPIEWKRKDGKPLKKILETE